jgi:hypothetical protein
MNRLQAIALAKQLIAQGDARRYLSDADGVWIETDQGWSPEPLWSPECEEWHFAAQV